MFLTFMILILLLSILLQIMIGVLYQKLINEAEQMQNTEDKNLKQCKVKFEKYYELNREILNISSFTEHALNHMKIGKIKITILSHLSGQAMLLVVLTGGLGAYFGIIEGAAIGELLPYYMISLFGLYVYFSITAFVNLGNKKELLKANIVDYLENTMLIRLKSVKEKEQIEKKMEREFQQEFQNKNKDIRKRLFTKPEEQELEELLNEFLT